MLTLPNRAKSIIGILALLIAFALGALLQSPLSRLFSKGEANGKPSAGGAASDSSAKAASTGKERKVLYWVNPMNPAIRSDKPGKAPDGMDYVAVYAEEAPPESVPAGSIKISAEKQQLIGVQYGEVTLQPVEETIRAVGKITYDETKIARVHSKIEGWIDHVSVDFTGKLVEKNQPLLSIYSPDLLATQQEFLIAKKGKDYLGTNANQEVAASAVSLYQSARERLRLWDISDEQIKGLEERGTPTRTLTLYSPVSGFVVTRNSFERQRITPDTELYTIADLSTVWVIADVYEYELPKIRLGQTARMTLTYFPGKVYTGKVSYIYPQVDNVTRTAKIRVEFANPDFTLKPDMYANVDLQIGYGKQVSVPEEAVLDSGNEQIVFVAREGGYFESRRVQLGGKVNNRYIVLGGLKEGEKIVTSGNFLVDSESRLKSATGAMQGMPGMPQKPGAEKTGAKKDAQPKGPDSNEMKDMPGMEGMPGMAPSSSQGAPKKAGENKKRPSSKMPEHQHPR